MAGILAFILAAIALLRRSWARLPLLAACAIAGLLTQAALFDWHEPSDMNLFGYFALNILMILAAGLALVISIVEYQLHRESTAP